MVNTIDLKKEIITRIKSVTSSWTEEDIYAISLFVYDEGDNPCEPTVTLGYNTERDYKQAVPSASNQLEARWNYAFWRQNQELVFGINETAKIVKQWIVEKGLPYYTYEELFENNVYDNIFECIDALQLEKITAEFVDVLICVVKELHETGFIEGEFGRKIPVIIHELEYYDKIAEQNIEANTLPLVQGLVDFINE
ncbi:MAG: hypothetical protein FWE86_00880 [Oscillospiraceae bacterium]|nr:hypothetical protein [Oscillospiraceae bacterium]